ncbi:MAG: RNA methyltransferase [Pseudomonadota bacterium]
MRGYFAVGVEGLSKPMNLGNLMRTAHAFGAHFLFTVAAHERLAGRIPADTSKSQGQVPYYAWPNVEAMALPAGCRLVGVELIDDAIDLPSFGHPLQAAYVLGAERGSLSKPMLARCDYVVRIPTAFCINVATAGAIVLYDRAKSLGRFPERPLFDSAQAEERPEHRHGGPKIRTNRPLPGWDY